MLNDQRRNSNRIIVSNDNSNDNDASSNDSFTHIHPRSNNNSCDNNYFRSATIGGCRDKDTVTSLRCLRCDQCEKIFTDSSVLHHHFKTVHSSGARSHPCPECNKNFASSSGLKQHQHIHQSVKPFQCEVCLKAYTQFSNLCRHKRMHADCRQQIRCDDCSQVFSTLMSLNKHRRFCDGVARHAPATSSSSAIGFLSLNLPVPSLPGALGLSGNSSVTRASALAVQPSPFATLESWWMHAYGCRPNGFPLCHPTGYMAACLPHLPSHHPVLATAAAAAAAQPSQFLFGPYMGLLPVNDDRKSDIHISSSSDDDEKARHKEKSLNHDGRSSVKSYDHGSLTSDSDKPAPVEIKVEPESTSRSQKGREKGDAGIDDDEDEASDRRTVTISSTQRHASPLLVTPSSEENGFCDDDDQGPLDLSMKPRPERRTPPHLSAQLSSPRSRTIEHLFSNHGSGNEHRKDVAGRVSKIRRTAETPGFVQSPGFLSPTTVYHLRKDLVTSYVRHASAIAADSRAGLGRTEDGSSENLTSPELNHTTNLRGGAVGGGYVRKPDSSLRSPLVSPLVRLPDILSFKPSKSRYRYSCRYCGKVFPRSANLTRHLRTHTGEQPYRCKYCKRCFSISSNLQRHVRNIHNKEKPFRCPLCDRCFGQQTNLDRHVKKHDADPDHVHDHVHDYDHVHDPCFSSTDFFGETRSHHGSRGSQHEVKGQGRFEEGPFYQQNSFSVKMTSSPSPPTLFGGQQLGQVPMEVTEVNEAESLAKSDDERRSEAEQKSDRVA